MSDYKCMECIHGAVCGDFGGSHAKDRDMFTAEREWIPVSERLPERPADEKIFRSWYLVALKSGCVKSLCFEFERGSWHETLSPVTHWMPLPEPPKEE